MAGHDRGGRVVPTGWPWTIRTPWPRAAILDIIPTVEFWRRVDGVNARSYYHWLLLSQPFDLPERLIGADNPMPERIATFDNDGTLWSEQPVPVQFYFVTDRVKALAPQHPEWKDKEPFASLLKGDLKAALEEAATTA